MRSVQEASGQSRPERSSLLSLPMDHANEDPDYAELERPAPLPRAA